MPTNPLTWTYTPEDLRLAVVTPKLVNNHVSDAQFVFNAGDEFGDPNYELEGNWTFTYLVTGASETVSGSGEYYVIAITLEIINNPCVPDMDYTEDGAVYTINVKLADREGH